MSSCTGTLVRHADESSDCDLAGTCGADLLVHDWALDCDDLGCDCGLSTSGQPVRHHLIAA